MRLSYRFGCAMFMTLCVLGIGVFLAYLLVLAAFEWAWRSLPVVGL